jgi:hypothetical protein
MHKQEAPHWSSGAANLNSSQISWCYLPLRGLKSKLHAFGSILRVAFSGTAGLLPLIWNSPICPYLPLGTLTSSLPLLSSPCYPQNLSLLI